MITISKKALTFARFALSPQRTEWPVDWLTKQFGTVNLTNQQNSNVQDAAAAQSSIITRIMINR
jgi:hypothetical protein